MRVSPLSCWIVLLFAVALACAYAPVVANSNIEPQALAGTRIDWFEGDVDAAFAAARLQNKPLFLYWGARWCPYCAQLESNVFVRPDFLELTRQMIAVHIDGDAENASQLGERFKVRGYPATLLFSAAGEEIHRLPAGATRPEVYLQALTLALATKVSIKQHVDEVLDRNQELSEQGWIQLARYPWYDDHQQALGQRPLAATLLTLGERCPESLGEPCRTLKLNALAESTSDGTVATVLPGLRSLLQQVLADPALIHEQSAFISDSAAVVLSALAADSAEAATAMKAAWTAALQQLADDESLTLRERLLAQVALIGLAGQGADELPSALISRTRALVAQADRASSDPAARQAVIGAAAHALFSIGDQAEAEALLERELPNSRAAYYLMGTLSRYAGQRGDAEAARQWQRRAFEDGARSDLPRVRERAATARVAYLIAEYKGVVAAVVGLIWLLSIVLLLWRSSLSLWLRIACAIVAVPLLGLLVTLSLVLVWQWFPSIAQGIAAAQTSGGGPHATAIFTVLFAVALAAAAFWGLSRLIQRFDRRLKRARVSVA